MEELLLNFGAELHNDVEKHGIILYNITVRFVA